MADRSDSLGGAPAILVGGAPAGLVVQAPPVELEPSEKGAR